jgi:hypothetical protein
VSDLIEILRQAHGFLSLPRYWPDTPWKPTRGEHGEGLDPGSGGGYQVIILRPYFRNMGKRLVKTPKVYFADVGTLCYLVVSCEGEMLKRDGKPFEKDFIKQAWVEAYMIRDLLTEKGVCNLRPQPVIVFTDADVQVKKRVRGVQIIGIKDLHAFLEGLPVWMSERLSKGIIECLSSTQNY